MPNLPLSNLRPDKKVCYFLILVHSLRKRRANHQKNMQVLKFQLSFRLNRSCLEHWPHWAREKRETGFKNRKRWSFEQSASICPFSAKISHRNSTDIQSPWCSGLLTYIATNSYITVHLVLSNKTKSNPVVRLFLPSVYNGNNPQADRSSWCWKNGYPRGSGKQDSAQGGLRGSFKEFNH
jgi:hypothetical protein